MNEPINKYLKLTFVITAVTSAQIFTKTIFFFIFQDIFGVPLQIQQLKSPIRELVIYIDQSDYSFKRDQSSNLGTHLPVPVFFSEKLSNGTHMLQKYLNFLILHFKNRLFTQGKNIYRNVKVGERKNKANFYCNCAVLSDQSNKQMDKTNKRLDKVFHS